MNPRDRILARIRSQTAGMTDPHSVPSAAPYPQYPTRNPLEWEDNDTARDAFIASVQSVGGHCFVLGAALDDLAADPRILQTYCDGHIPTVLHAHFGVVENGACWIDHRPDADRTRYTLPEHLAILLPRNALVATMHEAYARIAALGIDDFGLFLSGPSKTADIEQALVVGAQGAISTRIFLCISD